MNANDLQAGQKVRLRTAVLVQGPPGAGKRTAATAAASALGVHLVPFSCQELRGPSDSKTAAALTAAFEAAGHYAPAILLLRDLPSLVDSSIPAGTLASHKCFCQMGARSSSGGC